MSAEPNVLSRADMGWARLGTEHHDFKWNFSGLVGRRIADPFGEILIEISVACCYETEILRALFG